MKFKVISQSPSDERMFTLKREDGRIFYVDIFTDGGLEPPKKYYDKMNDKIAVKIFDKWLKSFIGKILEIDEITPLYYTTTGTIKIIN